MISSKRMLYFLFSAMAISLLSSRLLFLGSEISYDHKHYIAFFEEISNIYFFDILNNVFTYFPYVKWADFGKFEFGFSLLSYPISIIVNEQYTYVFLASLSVFLKLALLNRYNISVLFLLPFFVFSFSYFETNQLRASFAVIFLMYANYCYLMKNKVGFALFLNVVAMTFHVSSGFFLYCFIVHLFIYKIKQKKIISVLYFFSMLFCIVHIGDIFLILGGKLTEYYTQAVVYGLYTGSSGINTVSVFIFLWVGMAFFEGEERCGFSENKINYIKLVLFSMLILVLFSGPFSVLADRLWLMTFIVFYPFLIPKSIKRYPSVMTTTINFCVCLLYISLYLYISILSPVMIYPNSNVFQFFNLLSLDSPEAY